MPFTISHAAVALPISRLAGRQLPLLALAVGTMSPDLEFFIRGRIERSIGHKAHGVVLLDLPLSLIVLVVMSWLTAPGIAALLPDGVLHLGPAIKRDFAVSKARLRDPATLATISLAIMVGAGSHVVWDEFTHGPAPEGGALAWLNWFPFSVGEADFALHSILQWISTGLGLAVIVYALGNWVDHQPKQLSVDDVLEATPSTLRMAGWIFVAIVTLGFAAQHPLAFIGSGSGRPSGLGEQTTTSAIWAISGCVIALTLVGAAVQAGLIERWLSTEPGPNHPVPPGHVPNDRHR